MKTVLSTLLAIILITATASATDWQPIMQVDGDTPVLLVPENTLAGSFHTEMGAGVSVESVFVERDIHGVYYLVAKGRHDGRCHSMWIALVNIGNDRYTFPPEVETNLCRGTEGCSDCQWQTMTGCSCDGDKDPANWCNHTLTTNLGSNAFDWLKVKK